VELFICFFLKEFIRKLAQNARLQKVIEIFLSGGKKLCYLHDHKIETNRVVILTVNQSSLKPYDDMNLIKKTIFPIFLATIWISLSEFVRNEFLVKSFWTTHYQDLGLHFPSEPINGVVWGIWSLSFAVSIFIIAKKFTMIQTTFLSWVVAFVMMWIVVGNLGVLPYGLLLYSIPLSILESFIATLIIKKLS
jgi:hypothetical protein